MILIDKNQATLHFNNKDRQHKELDKRFDLISGAVCPACSNVIYASFLTDKPVKLRQYEQTSVMFTRTMDRNGEFSHYFPGDDEPETTSAYDVTLEKFGNQFIQTLRLKNHIMLPEQANKVGKEAMETGERTCLLSGVASINKQQAWQMAFAITGNPVANILKWKFDNPVLDHYMAKPSYNSLSIFGVRIEPSYGQIPLNVILIPKDKIENRLYYYAPPDSYRK